VDAELAGGLPQPDLVGELVGGLGQLTLLVPHQAAFALLSFVSEPPATWRFGPQD
jgi:hypothetical protein